MFTSFSKLYLSKNWPFENVSVVLLVCIVTDLVWHSSGVSEGRDDVHIEFVNNCDFDVNFAWYQTKCSGSSPNVLYLNELVHKGQSTSRIASVSRYANGRAYAWAADGMWPSRIRAASAARLREYCGRSFKPRV